MHYINNHKIYGYIMAFNMYKQIDKIKQELGTRGYDGNIPYDIFGKTIMVMFGMKRQTAITWIKNFDTVGLIKINNIDNTITII